MQIDQQLLCQFVQPGDLTADRCQVAQLPGQLVDDRFLARASDLDLPSFGQGTEFVDRLVSQYFAVFVCEVGYLWKRGYLFWLV